MNERDRYLLNRIADCGDWEEAEPYMRELMDRCGLDYDDDEGNQECMNCTDYEYDNDAIYEYCKSVLEGEE